MQNQGTKAVIGYGFFTSQFGPMLVAGTEHGVCAVEFGNDEHELVSALRQRYPRANIFADETVVANWAATLQAYLREGGLLPELPLDICGTPFQLLVWQLLQEIPVGQTSTYGAIAELAGSPRASRAVGQACGSNPVAVIVPCHRVMQKNGKLGGFRWDVQRKAALLAWERTWVSQCDARCSPS